MLPTAFLIWVKNTIVLDKNVIQRSQNVEAMKASLSKSLRINKESYKETRCIYTQKELEWSRNLVTHYRFSYEWSCTLVPCYRRLGSMNHRPITSPLLETVIKICNIMTNFKVNFKKKVN